jgi:hypothetical protein
VNAFVLLFAAPLLEEAVFRAGARKRCCATAAACC